ncbi:MAG TPA: 1-(5-phosphoribosyl)-5-[(5-phosphoribosylamino)methylideneamino] imidazole-4-carboxamide isomerase [Acidimicrobiales bacterium]|nr:1-(5-phosphoribosyl)-5-[(5-phosphoribosylamino)methylideneamino] imidazole-4-carboxamide isomerase [Acidimicrobiales bacterium]
MDLFCAIDVMAGRAVRLVNGEFGAAENFGDPLELAARFSGAGASWLHVVDLDAARTGARTNRDVVLSVIAAAHRAGTRVETGGGVRDERALDELVAAGADRVVLGTAAIEDPARVVGLAERHPGRVAVGLDYRRGPDGTPDLALRGWTESSGATPALLVDAWAHAPLAALVVTAIERDGTRTGPDLEGLSDVLDATALPVVASGGVGRVADLLDLARLRSPRAGRHVRGVVVGRALVDGSVDVEEAVASCAACG